MSNTSKFVMVEWDDGSGERTQWYLGHITGYKDSVPLHFQDLGIDAYEDERFSFLSQLMHHYLVYTLSCSN